MLGWGSGLLKMRAMPEEDFGMSLTGSLQQRLAWEKFMSGGDPTHRCSNCRAEGHSGSCCDTCGSTTLSAIPREPQPEAKGGTVVYTLHIDREARTVRYELPDRPDGDEPSGDEE